MFFSSTCFVKAEQNNLENTGTNLSTQNLNQPNQTQPMTNSQSSHHNSQNPLGTVAAKSVLEMGYSDDQVVQAIEKLRTLKRGMLTPCLYNMLIKIS